MQQDSPKRSLRKKIREVNPAEKRIPRKKEIQSHDFAAFACYPRDFMNCGLQIRKIPQAIANENAIEGTVAERQSRGIAASHVVKTAFAGQLQHGLGEINSDARRLREFLAHERREIARAASQIENRAIVVQRRLKHGISLPARVHSVRENARHKIIPRRNDAKHAAHELRILLFCRRVHLRHDFRTIPTFTRRIFASAFWSQGKDLT